METLTLQRSETDGVLVVGIIGYVSMENTGMIHDAVEDYLSRGGRSVVLDFTGCTIINSPGTAALMTLTMRVTDDFGGRMVIQLLDSVKLSLFELVGVFPIAMHARSRDEAVRMARTGH